MSQEKRTVFEKQDAILSQVAAKGFAAYVRELSGAAKAFVLKDRHIRCIDEGTPGGLHSAGSGILLGFEAARNSFSAVNVSVITSHDGCGAAKIYAKTQGLDESKSDEYAKEFSKKLAEELGLPYLHITAAEMIRPPEFHVARVVYYDGTGNFDCSAHEGFVPGFVISRGHQSAETSLAEAGVSIGIAFGGHGFGELILEEKPFILAAIGRTEEETEILKKELHTLAHSHGKCVVVDGFTRPA